MSYQPKSKCRRFEYRVTKYDISYRRLAGLNANNEFSTGIYTRNEWTSVSDIGRSFDGVILTPDEYQRVEDAYVAVAISFLKESRLSAVTVDGLENSEFCPIPLEEGMTIDIRNLPEVVRLILQEKVWCRLISQKTFLHFGYDYYMFVGVSLECPKSKQLARNLGLFVESFKSPYKGRLD